MHEKNIDLLRDEALRLLALAQQILQEIIDEPNLLTEPAAESSQTLDTQSAKKIQDVLKGEQTKLANLEMTLAVVGTMKAGKSTTINAIVGTEVLPNRNRPMTALPTLIRHTPGQVEPVLKFDNDQPIQTLLDELRIALHAPENQEELEKFLKGEGHDLVGLREQIKNKGKYERRYQGAEQIFEFLNGLNDLVRLSRCLQVEFPFVDYDEIHELPLIEVEFAHLRELEQVNGCFTLLDTPGPNEANQPDLKKMLREQLDAASAVLAVLDFTQLKSEADAEIRDELNDIADSTKGRLYTLVNKFDQKDRNSDSAEKIRAYVAADLMNGNIKAETVFPVSSRWGYLANRARHELGLHKRLPDPKSSLWVADFGKDALGLRWERDIGDVEKVTEAAEALWEDSLFDAPLQAVIQTAYANAAIFSLQSAVSKLIDNSKKNNCNKISNFIKARDGALNSDVVKLKKAIDSLKVDIEEIEKCQADAEASANDLLETLSNSLREMFGEMRRRADNLVEKYFGKEVQLRLDSLKKEYKVRINKRAIGEFVGRLYGLIAIRQGDCRSINDIKNNAQNSIDGSEVEFVEFDNKKDAQIFIGEITASLNKVIGDTNHETLKYINTSLGNFERNFFENIAGKMQYIIDDISKKLAKDSFDIELSMPELVGLKMAEKWEVAFDPLMQEKSRNVARRRRQDGAWGAVCGWLDTDDWGWERYQTEEQYVEICLLAVKARIHESINNLLNDLGEEIKSAIETPMQQSIEQCFSEIKEKVENLRGDLLQGMRDKQMHKKQKEDLMRYFAEAKKKLLDLEHDAEALKQDISAFSQSAQEAAR